MALDDVTPLATQEPAGISGLSDTALAAPARQRADGEGTRSVRLPHALASVPDSRIILVQDLQLRGLSSLVIEEAEMVVSELVANAVRHAKPLSDGCVRIRWKVKAGAVEVEVSDGGGPTVPRPQPQSVWAVGGRGLRIVRSLAHEWGVQDDRNGRTVWAALGGPSRRRRL
ncbi:MAG: ATP-binding protein [Austwickia sp.]|jgi:serine/threonine-protein kinase RsbW|nr:ATP-binding protein [Austwickia sp.]MBK8437095.1 ATP-binding protein [Austwickia sp.]MBK9102330.1 ATP-binding protein [Austwickia sp.]